MTHVKTVLLMALVAVVSGCATGPDYRYQSPTVDTVRDSGGMANSRRDDGSVRHEPYTTLGSAVGQAAPVQITVTFTYSSRQRGTPRVSNCVLHIKGSDTSLSDQLRCKIEPAGNSFMISFKTDEGEKSFDLHALNGHYDGGRPLHYTGNIISIGLSSARKQTLRYIYLGQDPFGIQHELKEVERTGRRRRH